MVKYVGGVDSLEDKKNYGDLLMLAIKSILLALCGVVFPFLYIFFPSMYIVESIKEGILKIMGIFIGVCVLLGAIFNPIDGFVVFTIFGPLILVFHYMITSRKSRTQIFIAGAISFFASVIVLLVSFGINSEVLNSKKTLEGLINIYTNIGSEVGLADTEFFDITSRVSNLYYTFLQMAPSYLIISSLVFSYIVYISVVRTMFAKGRIIIGPPTLEFIKIPKEVIFLGFATIGVLYLLKFPQGTEIIYKNLLFILLFLLFVEGLAIIKFFMTSMKISRFLQTIIIIVSLTFPFLQMLFIFLGAVDLFIDFRKIGV